MVQPIPDDYPRISIGLAVDGAADAIEFYRSVLGAEVRRRMDEPGGRVMHSELEVGDALLMVGDEHPDMGFVGPRRIGGTPVFLSVYVEDADAVMAAALDRGATVRREMADQFFGDRSGQFEDPWGHVWNVATHVEDVSDEEMTRRAQEATEG